MTAENRIFAIFPDDVGAILQYIGEAPSADAAFEEFTGIVGDHAEREAFRIIAITSAQRTELEAWYDAGSPGDEVPEWLDQAIRYA